VDAERWQRAWHGAVSLSQRRRLLPQCPDDLTRVRLYAELNQAEARKAERKVAKNASKAQRHQNQVQGRRNKRNGANAERMVARMLGPAWKRVPLSGALGGSLSGDVAYAPRGAHGLERHTIGRLETKRRRGADKGLRDHLAQGNADALVRVYGRDDGALPGTKQDEPLVIMRFSAWRVLLIEAGYEVEA